MTLNQVDDHRDKRHDEDERHKHHPHGRCGGQNLRQPSIRLNLDRLNLPDFGVETLIEKKAISKLYF